MSRRITSEGFLEDECLTSWAMHFEGMETRMHRPVRNDDYMDLCSNDVWSVLSSSGRHLAHDYVLFNCIVRLKNIDSKWKLISEPCIKHIFLF